MHEPCKPLVMIRNSLILILIAAFFTNCSVAQSGNKYIRNTYAYCKFSSPGNIMADDNGNQVNSLIQERIIYIEIKGTAKPVIRSIISGKYGFTGTASLVEQYPASPGNDPLTGNPVNLKKRSGYNLWRIDLSPLENQSNVPAKPLGNYRVRGTINGRSFSILIKQETALAPDLRY